MCPCARVECGLSAGAGALDPDTARARAPKAHANVGGCAAARSSTHELCLWLSLIIAETLNATYKLSPSVENPPNKRSQPRDVAVAAARARLPIRFPDTTPELSRHAHRSPPSSAPSNDLEHQASPGDLPPRGHPQPVAPCGAASLVAGRSNGGRKGERHRPPSRRFTREGGCFVRRILHRVRSGAARRAGCRRLGVIIFRRCG